MADSYEESGEKYFLIRVPDHASQSSTEASKRMTTFLRLGTFDDGAPGVSLLNQAMPYIDDGRDRGRNEAGPPAGGPGHLLDKGARTEETNRLTARGGWQDHSDGDRVSTTMGDKLEVVRGNYKLIVLGRQDDMDRGSGFEFSGGHVQQMDDTNPSYQEIKWVKTWDGCWKVYELNEKGDVHNITHGNSKEERYGDLIDSVTGSEDQGELAVSTAKPKVKKNNPTITEKTWAKSITSQTGSEKTVVDEIKETTWAKKITSNTGSSGKYIEEMNSTTYVKSLSDVTHVSNKFTNSVVGSTATIVNDTGNATEGVGTVTNNTYAGAMFENTVVGAAEEIVTAGALGSLTTAGALKELKFAGAALGLLIAGIHIDIELAAIRGEVKGGGAFFELELGIFYLEFFLGMKMEISVARVFKATKGGWSDVTGEAKIGIGL
ncbi:MAG: hypothetical protein U0271_40355 [Polyangiaceae bacterium]